MKRLPRKLKKQIKKIPIGSYCYGSTIGGKYKMVNDQKLYKGGCCPFWHHSKIEGFAYCSLWREHNDFLLADQTKLLGCNYYGKFFDSDGHFSKKLVELENRYSQIRWQTAKLEGFLIIHENHITGLQTFGGSIFIEDILDDNNSMINAFHFWLEQLPKCKNNIEYLKEHYRLGLKIAKRIKQIVGSEILVDYWWINPNDIKKGRKRRWEGIRIEPNEWISFHSELDFLGYGPSWPFDINKATKSQLN